MRLIWVDSKDVQEWKQVGAWYPPMPRDPKTDLTRDRWAEFEEGRAQLKRDLKEHCTRGKTIRVIDDTGDMIVSYLVADAFARVRELHLSDVSDTGVHTICAVLERPHCKLETLVLDSDTRNGIVCERLRNAIVANKSLRQIQLRRPSDLLVGVVAVSVNTNEKFEGLSIWFPREPLSRQSQFVLSWPRYRTLKIAGVHGREIRASVEAVRERLAKYWSDAVFDPITDGFCATCATAEDKQTTCCIL